MIFTRADVGHFVLQLAKFCSVMSSISCIQQYSTVLNFCLQNCSYTNGLTVKSATENDADVFKVIYRHLHCELVLIGWCLYVLVLIFYGPILIHFWGKELDAVHFEVGYFTWYYSPFCIYGFLTSYGSDLHRCLHHYLSIWTFHSSQIHIP